MRLTFSICLFCVLQSFAIGSFSQNLRLSINQKNINIENVLQLIEDQTDYYFMYSALTVDVKRTVDLEATNKLVTEILDDIFKNTNVSYKINGRLIALSKDGDTSMMAQQVRVSGKVTDSSGAPLPGVSVVIKGTTNGTITDFDGKYTLANIPGDATLVFSFVGMKTQEIQVAGKTEIDIVMSEETVGVEEVLVVSYGTQKRREVTGSISNVKAEELENLPVSQFAQKLQGQFSGVQISQSTGRPGQGVDFRIRGSASINAGNQPLFVIDGQPMLGVRDNINTINPDEIETFTVLKDASATALYGSRAANGVIIITTKQGKAGPTRFEFNSYVGIASFPQERKPNVMNATELATYMKGFFEDKIKYEGYTKGIPVEYQNPEQYGKGTDWFGIMLRNAPIQNYSLSISHATERNSASIVGGYLNEQGIMKNTGYQRFSVRINNEFRPNENIKLGINFAPTLQFEHNNRINTDGDRQIISAALYTNPMAPYRNEDGSLAMSVTGYSNLFSWPNWYRVLMETQDDITKIRILGNAYAEFKFLKDFTFRTQANTDIAVLSRKTFKPSTAQGGLNSVPPRPATGSATSNSNYSWLVENLLTYDKTFAKDHTVQVLAGITAQKWNDYVIQANGSEFPDDQIPYLNYASTITGSTTSEEWALLSIIARLNYNYKCRYILQAAIRRDGSSRFGYDNRYGTFPSVSAGWIVSDESFMKNIKQINYLKIRASYGSTGNNEIGNYRAIALLGRQDYVFRTGIAQGKAQTSLGNSLLSWEKNEQFDIGVDLAIFNDRISFSYDYYNKLTDGLLYQINVPRASGFTSVQSNIGTFKFWGHEFSLTSRNLTGKVKWTTNFNISFNDNEVIKLGTNNAPIGGTSEFGDWKTEVGRPMGQFYGYVFDGVYMNQAEFDAGPKHSTSKVGTVRMKDLNNDGIIDMTNDRTYIGNPNPDFIFGLTNSFSYRNWDFSIITSGTYGNEIKYGMAESLENLDGVFNGPKYMLDRWRSEENPGNGKIARTLAGTTVLARTDNSKFIFDGSHLTVNNITLGYSLSKIYRMPFIKKLRVYASVQNVYIFTKYPGMNPEVNQGELNGLSQGQDLGNYPVPRTFSIGINMGF